MKKKHPLAPTGRRAEKRLRHGWVYAPTWANDQPQLSAFLKTALAAAGVGRLRDLIAHYEQSFALWQEPDGYSFKKDRRSMKAKRAIRREIKRSLAILEVLRRS